MTSVNAMFASVRYTNVNQMLQGLGLPQNLANTLQTSVDPSRPAWESAAMSLLGMTQRMSGSQLERMFGTGLPGAGYMPRPGQMLQRNRMLFGATFASIHGSFTSTSSVATAVARSVEQMASNPQAQARMGQVLGGQVVADGRMDMRITVQRHEPYVYGVPYNQTIAASPQQNGLYGALANLEKNILGVAGQLVRGGANSGSWSLSDPVMADIAKQMNIKPPLAFEDLMFLNMMTYSKNKEGQIMGTMNQLVRNTQGQPQGMQGAMQTSLGGPSLYGGLVGGGAGQAMMGLPGGNVGAMGQALFGPGGAAYMGIPGAGGAPAAPGGGYNPMDPNQSDATRQSMLQKLMQDLQRMYNMISNVQKSMHDQQMAAIRNIR